MGALLTADIEHALLHVENGLQGECALADSGLSTQQDDAARNKSSTQHSVKFPVACAHTALFPAFYVTQT